jgi:hypothetical protein
MHRYKQFISLGIVFLGSMSFLDVPRAQAQFIHKEPQYVVPWEIDATLHQTPEQIRRGLDNTEGRSDDVPLQYGAISRSHDTRRYGWVWGYDDYEADQNAADQECGVSDCSSLFFGNGFGAIAATSDHWTVYEADTPEQAAQDALEDCQYFSEIPDTCEVILIVGSKEGTIFPK